MTKFDVVLILCSVSDRRASTMSGSRLEVRNHSAFPSRVQIGLEEKATIQRSKTNPEDARFGRVAARCFIVVS
jgi:hypothetical protein